MQFDAYYQTNRQNCYSSWIGENNPRGDRFLGSVCGRLKIYGHFAQNFLKKFSIIKISTEHKNFIGFLMMPCKIQLNIKKNNYKFRSRKNGSEKL